MSNYNKLSDTEYIKVIDEAINYYNEYIKKLPLFDTNEITESEYHPMHPHMYFQLINVRGFANLNGSTYQEYIQLWETRANITF